MANDLYRMYGLRNVGIKEHINNIHVGDNLKIESKVQKNYRYF